jgi:hypothetical protein
MKTPRLKGETLDRVVFLSLAVTRSATRIC